MALLHDALPSQQASLSLSSRFSNSSVPSTNPSLPFTVALMPGVLSYPQSLYRGQSTFTQLSAGPNRTTTTVPPGSFLVAPNTWAALTSSNTRIIVRDLIPDLTQLPLSSVGGTLSLTDIQSMACSSRYASTGTYLASGQCSCVPGFTGSSRESRASGSPGPSCHPCPSGCATCNEGLTGSGKCLVVTVPSSVPSCPCDRTID